MVQDLTMADQ